MVEKKGKKIEEQTKSTIDSKKPEIKVEGGNSSSTKKFPKKFINKKFDNKRRNGKNERKGQGKPRSEYEQKIISLRRVTRVVAGGRRFTFSVGMVIGDRNGSVGVGLGKAADTALAIEKAIRDAKKNMIKPLLTKTKSIPYNIDAKYCASRVIMVPTPKKGLKAGGAMRTILELLGAKDVTGKILSRSKNHVNNARATIKALEEVGVRSSVNIVSSASDKEKVLENQGAKRI